jgi:hypothetical protein
MKLNVLGFSTKELRLVVLTLFFIIALTFLNLRTSLRKGRDAQRKDDVRAIYDALMKYQNDFGFFPPSTPDGKIEACKGENNSLGIPAFRACDWYVDPLRDIFDESYPPYLATIPGDPRQGQGRSYFYISSSRHFQIFASFESSGEDEYSPQIASRNLNCGKYICNFGRSDGSTPLDKSLQEYENELLELENAKNNK